MPEPESLTPGDNELISALGNLSPMGDAIDRDQLMFKAGRASVHRSKAVWQGTTLLLVATLCVSLLLNLQETNRPTTQIPMVQVQTFTPEPLGRVDVKYERRPGDGAFLKLRNNVLVKGVDALPTQNPSKMNTDEGNWQNELLGKPKVPDYKPTGFLQSLFSIGERT